jgi:hypothetical protein
VSEQEGRVSAWALQIDVHGDVVDMQESVGHTAADSAMAAATADSKIHYHLKHTTETPFSSPSI